MCLQADHDEPAMTSHASNRSDNDSNSDVISAQRQRSVMRYRVKESDIDDDDFTDDAGLVRVVDSIQITAWIYALNRCVASMGRSKKL